jgi:hypothetical protein
VALDERLVAKAKAAAAALAEAERRAQLAQAEYHTFVRRAHLAGGSLREIAQALGLSHQRVQQIVQSAGGTWWGRVWRSRNPRRDMVCTFCGRPPSEVSRLLAGPNVYICEGCVVRAEGAIGARATKGVARCSFCGKKGAGRQAVTMASATICSECLTISRQILDARAEDG